MVFLARVFRQRPILIFDDATFTDCRSGEVIPWDSVFDVYLRQRQGVFGVYHHLVFTIRQGPAPQDLDKLAARRTQVQTVRRSIDQLSMSWSDIVTLVQKRLGKEIPIRHEAGLFRKPLT
jgi:hypothetical protein